MARRKSKYEKQINDIVTILSLSDNNIQVSRIDQKEGRKNVPTICITSAGDDGARLYIPQSEIEQALEIEDITTIDIAYEIYNNFQEFVDVKEETDGLDTDDVLDKISVYLVSEEGKNRLLEQHKTMLIVEVPELKDFGDRKLYAVPYIVSADDTSTISFDRELLEVLNMAEEEIYNIAIKNTQSVGVGYENPESDEYNFKYSAKEISELYEDSDTKCFVMKAKIFGGRYGASAMLLKKELIKLSLFMDDDLILMPVNKHEVAVSGMRTCGKTVEELRDFMSNAFNVTDTDCQVIDDFYVFTKDTEEYL